MDGKTVSEENYLKAAGSLVLTLKSDYLDTLAEGEHTVGITFTDGTAEAKLAIEAAPAPSPTPAPRPVPQTGDQARPFIWITLLMLALAGLLVITATLKASRRK